MSQPSTQLSHTAADPSLPMMDQEQQLSQADFEELFGTGGAGRPIFSSNHSDLLNELGFTYEDGYVTPVESSNTSTISMPDFSSCKFRQNAPAYPSPGPNSPHPCPLELQRAYSTTADQQDFDHRPRSTISQTNNVYIYPAQSAQCYGRRRSLSTSDTDRIVATNSITNPTFIRLQAPRARSTASEEKRRNGQHSQHGRSASQGPLQRGRPMNPTSMPYHVHSDLLVGGMLPTPIGTPLNEITEVQDISYCAAYHSTDTADLTTCSENPVFRHMTRPDELARSRHIIEIGALVVSNRSRLDTRLEPPSPNANRTRISKKLGDIEEYLGDKEGEEALSACKTILDALSKKTGAEGSDVADEVVEDHLKVPSKAPAETKCEMYDVHDDDEIMEMLMRENGIDGQDADEKVSIE